MQIEPYLNLNGDCEAAFKFYEKCFGGKIQAMFTHGNSPMAEHTPKEWHAKILHASLLVDGRMLMGSDVPPQYFEKPQGFSVSINVKDPAEAERIFGELAEGGIVKMPVGETFWALRFGMVVDRFGIPWMINCEKPSA